VIGRDLPQATLRPWTGTDCAAAAASVVSQALTAFSVPITRAAIRNYLRRAGLTLRESPDELRIDGSNMTFRFDEFGRVAAISGPWQAPTRVDHSRSRLRRAALTRSSSVPPIVASDRAIRDNFLASAAKAKCLERRHDLALRSADPGKRTGTCRDPRRGVAAG
jgi:hypothetical protein